MTRVSAARCTWALTCAVAVLSAAAPADRGPDLADLLNRYDRGEFAEVVRAMAELPPPPNAQRIARSDNPAEPVFLELQRLAPAWIETSGSDAASRRRLVLAAFALELTNARPSVSWTLRYPMLVWACELLRTHPTQLPGERWWHLASIALYQDMNDWLHLLGAGVVRPSTSEATRFFSVADKAEFSAGHLSHARLALGDEPRLLLADVYYAERQTFLSDSPAGITAQQTSPQLLDSFRAMLNDKFNARPPRIAPDPRALQLLLDRVDRLPALQARYEDLARHPALRGDALLHLAFLRMRLEAWNEALAHLDAALRVSREPMVIGMSHHFRGWIFEQTGRRDDAIEAYRAALAVAPLARSTSILLAAQLGQTGRQEEAYEVLDAALKARPAPDRGWAPEPLPRDAPADLWPLYQRGDALMLRAYLERLREALR